MKSLMKYFLIALILLLVTGNYACFKEIVETRKPPPDIIWPRPPEIPRIRLVNSISRPADLNIQEKGLTRLFRFIKGVETKFMVTPYGVVTDRDGRLYVVDNFTRLVHVFDRKRSAFYTFPEDGTLLTSPIGIALDNKGNVYVSDSKDAVIRMFQKGGKKYIGELGRGLLERPTGLTFNTLTNELLVVDTESSQVLRFDVESRRVKGVIGRRGNIKGYFYKPTNIFTTREGNIIVSDSLNFRIQVLSPEGEFINAFGSAGNGPGYFSRPRGVAADSDGNIYVVDALFDNIQIFDRQGKLLMDFGSPGNGYGEFWLPSGIFIDAEDRIYVADSYNHRVQVFKYLKEDEF